MKVSRGFYGVHGLAIQTYQQREGVAAFCDAKAYGGCIDGALACLNAAGLDNLDAFFRPLCQVNQSGAVQRNHDGL